MAYLIGMISQKGGAGKSTLARLLARELAVDGFAVKIADLDTQQTTCTDWGADRAEAGLEPELQAQAFGNLKTALSDSSRFDAYIFDGRPHSSTQSLDIAKAVDLVVIPTGQTKDDLRPAVKFANALADAGVTESRIVFALVKTTNSLSEIDAARAYLDQTDYAVLDGYLPVSTAYGTAHDAGRTVTETFHKSLNAKAAKLAQSIVDRLVSVTEHREAV